MTEVTPPTTPSVKDRLRKYSRPLIKTALVISGIGVVVYVNRNNGKQTDVIVLEDDLDELIVIEKNPDGTYTDCVGQQYQVIDSPFA